MFEPNHIQKDVFKFLTHSEYVAEIIVENHKNVEIKENSDKDAQSKQESEHVAQSLEAPVIIDNSKKIPNSSQKPNFIKRLVIAIKLLFS